MKKIFDEKKYSVKKILSKKICKINFGQKKICEKNFLVKKNFQRKKIWSNKIPGQKNSG